MLYLANRDVLRAKNRENARRTREANSERHKRWAEANAVRLYAYQWLYRNDPNNKARKAQLSREQPAANAARARARYMRVRQAIPPWADLDAIRAIYEKVQTLRQQTGLPYEVDHVVPVNSAHVCGLHCEANLQVLLEAQNIAKGNRHWPDMWDCS